jgi:ABC-type glycerol-3-phosphate transport system substrate-binding protein
MARRLSLLLVAALMVAACGGSTSPTSVSTAEPTPTSQEEGPVVLDSGNFTQLVLESTRPCLVEFQMPT